MSQKIEELKAKRDKLLAEKAELEKNLKNKSKTTLDTKNQTPDFMQAEGKY